MRQMVTQVLQVCLETIASDGLARRRGVGKGFVSGRDPESVQYPAVAGVRGEPRRVTLVTKRSNLAQQGIELEQSVPVRATLNAHKADAARRSGLT